MKYKVTIIGTFSTKTEVDAETLDQAKELATRELYKDSDVAYLIDCIDNIILDPPYDAAEYEYEDEVDDYDEEEDGDVE